MSSDGKQLEGLVAFVERTLLSKGPPDGFYEPQKRMAVSPKLTHMA